MSSLSLRLASTMAPQSVTDLVETVHTQLGVSLWLVMSWLKAVTVVNGLEQNMLVFINCVANFVRISMQIINTVSDYALWLVLSWVRAMTVINRLEQNMLVCFPDLFSTMADRACRQLLMGSMLFGVS